MGPRYQLEQTAAVRGYEEEAAERRARGLRGPVFLASLSWDEVHRRRRAREAGRMRFWALTSSRTETTTMFSCTRQRTYFAERAEAAVDEAAVDFEAVLLRDEILVVHDQRYEGGGDELTTRKIAAERSKRTQKWRTENYVGTHGQQNSREGKRRGKRGKRRGSGELPGRKFRAQISCDRQSSRQLAGVLQATFETFSRA